MSGNEKEVCNIAEGTVINGTFKSNAHLRLEGKIFGNIHCKGRLVLAATASIEGDIECEALASEGKIKGNVACSGLMHLQSTAQLVGNVHCTRMQIDEGAAFNGQCTMQLPAGK